MRSRSPLVGSGTDCTVHIEPPYVPDSHVKVAVDVLFGFAPRKSSFDLLVSFTRVSCHSSYLDGSSLPFASGDWIRSFYNNLHI